MILKNQYNDWFRRQGDRMKYILRTLATGGSQLSWRVIGKEILGGLYVNKGFWSSIPYAAIL